MLKTLSRLKSIRAFVVPASAPSLLVVALAASTLAQSQSLPTVLESGSNDVISLQRGQIPDASTQIAPLSPSKVLRKSAKNRAVSSKSVGSRSYSNKSVSSPSLLLSAPQQVVRPNAAPSAVPSIGTNSLVGGSSVQSDELALPEPEAVLESGVAERLVTVCLNNAASKSGTKAFDVQRRGVPRFVAGSGKTICAQFEPTRQTIYFWKTNSLGKLALTLSNRLDLRDSEGTQIMLNWEQD